MITILIITISVILALLITMLTIVAVDQQRQIKKGKPIKKRKPEVVAPLSELMKIVNNINHE